MNETIELKKISLAEWSTLQKIGKETFVTAFGEVNTQENMDDYLGKAFSKQQLEKELNNSHSTYYFVTMEEQIIGYLKVNFGPAQTDLQDPNGLEIERIYITKDYQGLGIGHQLIKKVIALAKEEKLTYVWLGVWNENIKAIKFYENNGFVEFDQHAFYLGDDLQTDIMMKYVIS